MGVIILPITEKKKAANARWDAANLKRISVAMPVDLHTRMVRHIKETGETTNRFVKRAIDETIIRDDGVFYKDEILSDNSHANYCEQCRDCILWGDGDDPFQNRHDKASCSIYPHPDHKPGYVINNQGSCEFKKTK